jgi:hypothetical protein
MPVTAAMATAALRPSRTAEDDLVDPLRQLLQARGAGTDDLQGGGPCPGLIQNLGKHDFVGVGWHGFLRVGNRPNEPIPAAKVPAGIIPHYTPLAGFRRLEGGRARIDSRSISALDRIRMSADNAHMKQRLNLTVEADLIRRADG